MFFISSVRTSIHIRHIVSSVRTSAFGSRISILQYVSLCESEQFEVKSRCCQIGRENGYCYQMIRLNYCSQMIRLNLAVVKLLLPDD
jgi:hypothetical protein